MQLSQTSAHILNRLFNIRSSEWPRVSLMFLMIALTNVGVIWGTTTAYATFLKQAGIEVLPWVLVLSSVLSIIAIAIYTAFADRVANDRLLLALYVINSVSIVLGLVLLWLGYSSLAYLSLYLLDFAGGVVFNSHFITYVNGYYDIRSAKRVLPIVTAGARAGAILAGLTMPFFNMWLAPGAMIVIWLLIYFVVMGLILLMPYLLKEKRTRDDQSSQLILFTTPDSETQNPSYIENMREGFRYVAQSTFLRWMAIGMLLLMVLMALIEYRSSKLLLEIYGTSEALSSYIALLVGIGNIVVLPMLLVGISRLIGRIGLGNAKMLFPVGNLVICGGLIFAPGLAGASFAYLDRTAFRITFQSPIDNLLYNAVPLRVKGRARAFVGGLVVPIGSLIGGVLLFLPLISTVWFGPALIGVLAVAYLVSAWFTRRQYSRALINMLEQEDYSSLFSQEAADLTVTDPTMLKQLQQRLEQSPTPEFTVFMAQLICQVGGSNAIPILWSAARAATDAHTRAAIINVLVASNVQGNATRQFFAEFLADTDGHVRQSAIAGLAQLVGSKNKTFLDLALRMLSDPDLEVRIQVLPALLSVKGSDYQTAAIQTLNDFLNSQNTHQRARGLYVLNHLGDVHFMGNVLEHLTDPADEVRLEAALAIETLSNERISASDAALIFRHLDALLQDPIERVRQAALVVLGRIGTNEAYHKHWGLIETYQKLVSALTDASPQVRAVAADVLVQIGKAAIPVVHPKLDSPDPQLRKMAAVILSRIDRREFGPLVGTHVTGNLLCIYRNYNHLQALTPYAESRSITVLQNVLRERNQEFIDEIFYLLRAIHDPEAIETIAESLEGETVRVRANAVEALESLTSPDTARLMRPLFEPERSPGQLLAISKEIWDMPDPNPAVAIRQLLIDAETPWLRAITALALGEMGAALQKDNQQKHDGGADDGDENQARESRRKSRRLRPADLLGQLADTPAPPSLATDEARPTSTLPQIGFTLSEIEAMLEETLADSVINVQIAAQVAKQMLSGQNITELVKKKKEGILLSVVERIIFLKEVPFFQGMTVNQLEVLANVCEEELFEEDQRIFEQNDPGGVLYVVVSGKVGIEREGTRKGSTARLATLDAHAYFGEMSLFDNSPRSATAVALQDTLTLRLRREPLIALARQYPELSIELINVLSQRLRESNEQIAKLTRSRPRELQKLFDKFD